MRYDMDLWMYEREQWRNGVQTVCGVDEAGAGPLAGPVYAAAVILPRELEIPGLNDSKKLTERARERLFPIIKEKALAYIEAAKKDGIEFPVHLDMLVDETSKARSDRARSMADSISSNTDGQIIIELVMRDSDTVTNIAYRNQDPATMDYDISTFTGWGPDYADPKTFVDIYSPVTGYYMKAMGLEAGPLDQVSDADIKQAVGLVEYENLYKAADAITDDLDARYRAFAAADAELVESAFYIPTSTNTRSVRVTHVVPFSRVYSVCGMTEYKHKGMQLQEDIVKAEDYNAAYEEWIKG
jgi:oligopeptide transport system substrate-binding protein